MPLQTAVILESTNVRFFPPSDINGDNHHEEPLATSAWLSLDGGDVNVYTAETRNGVRIGVIDLEEGVVDKQVQSRSKLDHKKIKINILNLYPLICCCFYV
jgi:hypothetical protein